MDEVMYREEQWKSSTSTILWATMASIIVSMLPLVVLFLALLDIDFFDELLDSDFFNWIVNLAACGFGIVALMSVYKFRDIQTTADDRSGVSVLAVGYILLVVSDGLSLIWSLSDSESLFVPIVVSLAWMGNLICWIIGGTTLKNKSSWPEVGKGGASCIAKSCYSAIGFLLLMILTIISLLDGYAKTGKFMGASIVILGYYYFYMYRGWKWIMDAYDPNSESYAEYEKSNSTAEGSNVSEEPHPNVAAVQQPVPQPMQQPVQQPAQQPMQQPVQQPAQQPMRQPMQQRVPQPMQQPMQQRVPQPVPQPMQQPVPQPMQQPMQQPVQQPAQQPMQQPVQQPMPQPMQQPMRQPMQQSAPRPMPQQQFQHPQYRQPVANQRKFCPNCGAPLLGPSHFCSCCGTRL